MDLPMLLDGSSHILPWERLNHRFAETFGFGVSIKRLADIPQLVTNLLAFDGQKLAVYRNNMMEFQKKNPEEEMLKLIKAILQ